MLLGHARMHPWVQSCALRACAVRAVRCANSKHVQQVHAAAGVHAETSASAGAIGCEVQCNRMCCKQSTDVQCGNALQTTCSPLQLQHMHAATLAPKHHVCLCTSRQAQGGVSNLPHAPNCEVRSTLHNTDTATYPFPQHQSTCQGGLGFASLNPKPLPSAGP